ncbi:hypothetical protein MEN41_02380 [Dolichospermum sp. ST_con]|uniref:hypothetical protein n=1 Tax=Dolichospermum circinale TaxID=109265 RepID=UPI00232F33AD|nr:hypothetical protein [Dolichospermum circinale]MDD1413542.1 hypothetical protein [Dolichospermum sp. ST_con]MDD1421775.1 hypothetical protein [Dolichospermum sp. ST_sed1]MDD1425344.1 hypothetical protein [Dolichospermum sp. ST_sed9]MDD1430997.1 hypothetical protein [Dolichospermum sp. ST_sed6]MDD1438502.1 hypothetical protein [Dolichospermum sp. ST_sed10]MDD1441130.1 hypothetical protein [Dolichospermum sp. ST_sed3]MDD1446934.1 hypothetical protein [Dolichospermum sp. ST_sed8]MDD1455113.
MSSKTFRLEFKEGLLIIPSEVREYLHHCPQQTEIALMIQSALHISFQDSDPQTSPEDFKMKWNSWFEEVDNLEIISSDSEVDDYGSALLEKYRSQGLDV